MLYGASYGKYNAYTCEASYLFETLLNIPPVGMLICSYAHVLIPWSRHLVSNIAQLSSDANDMGYTEDHVVYTCNTRDRGII